MFRSVFTKKDCPRFWAVMSSGRFSSKACMDQRCRAAPGIRYIVRDAIIPFPPRTARESSGSILGRTEARADHLVGGYPRTIRTTRSFHTDRPPSRSDRTSELPLCTARSVSMRHLSLSRQASSIARSSASRYRHRPPVSVETAS